MILKIEKKAWITIFFSFLFSGWIANFFLLLPPDPDQKKNSIAKIGIKNATISLNPFGHLSVAATTISKHLYESLVELDNKNRVIPKACERFEFDKEKNMYTFYLRQTKWSDGTPVTAYDFERAWKDNLENDQKQSLNHYMGPIKGVLDFSTRKNWDEIGIHVRDDRTLEVMLEEDSSSFLSHLALPFFCPRHSEWKGEFGPTNGPFFLKRWIFEHSIQLKKNPFYWDVASIHLDFLEFQIIHDKLGLLLAEKKKLHFCELPENLPFVESDLCDSSRLYVLNQTCRTRLICINTTHPLLANHKIRQALSLSLDRETLVQVVSRYGKPAYTMVPPHISSIEKHLVQPIREDAILAKKLLEEGLEELGLERSDFQKICFYFPTTLPKEVPEAIQQRWNKILNIFISIRAKDAKSNLENLARGKPGLYALTWCPDYVKVMDCLQIFIGHGLFHWNSEDFDALIKKAEKADTDQQMERILAAAEQILLKEASVIPIYRPPALFIIDRALRNFQISPMHVMDFSRSYWDPKK